MAPGTNTCHDAFFLLHTPPHQASRTLGKAWEFCSGDLVWWSQHYGGNYLASLILFQSCQEILILHEISDFKIIFVSAVQRKKEKTMLCDPTPRSSNKTCLQFKFSPWTTLSNSEASPTPLSLFGRGKSKLSVYGPWNESFLKHPFSVVIRK